MRTMVYERQQFANRVEGVVLDAQQENSAQLFSHRVSQFEVSRAGNLALAIAEYVAHRGGRYTLFLREVLSL